MATQTLQVGVLVDRWRHRLTGIVAIGLAATALGCSREETSAPTEKVTRSTEALSAITIRTYGFESLSDWSAVSSNPTLSLSTTHVEGLRSLSVAGGGWSAIQSRILVKEDPAPTTVGFDLRIPSPQPNPSWFGTVQLFVSIPSQGINNLPLGLHDLIQWTPGQFRRAEFNLPANVQTALNTNFNDLRWRIELNRPVNATAGYLFDRFTYGPLCTPQSDNNPCTTDTCNAQGQQVHTPVAAGTSCSDSNACNGAETCNATGSCVAGTPPNLNDNNPCTTDACNPATGVTHTPVAAGTSCADSNACNGAETCNAQAGCVAGTPVTCTASDQCHDAGTCNPATGACSNPQKQNGTACNDASACTQTDTCQAGTCTGGNPVVCAASDQCHDPGTCNPANGVCSNPAKPNGATCSDANACTQTDTCQAGACTGTNPVVCVASDSCHDPGTCSPTNGTCSNPAKPNGTTCNDATVCNGSESCQSGTCTAGTPPVTDDGNECTADACDPVAGVTHTPVAVGTSCADGDACDGAETCNGSGVCAGGTPVVCAASDQCHDIGTCNPSTGVCSNPAKPDGSACSDADVCTQSDSCQAGTCAAGTPTTTDDGNPCTADACDPITGVSHTPVSAGTSCSNANACDGSELCNGTGTCVAGTPPEFDDGNPCTADACDPMGGVTHTPSPAGTHCGDENLCNGNETCDGAGSCISGTPPELDDDNPCTADTCDPFQGVVHTPVPSGASCSDLDFCNGNELCDAAGACQPGTPVSTEDGNACTSGTCDPLTGTVTQSPMPAGTECFIDTCTLGECNATGECTAAGSTVVDDGDPCTVEWCDPELGPQMKRCSDIDPTVGTTLHESMKWIYEQPNPPQIGVVPGTIEIKRAATLRGIVKTRDGSVLSGVKVTILDHPEYGYTLTHADGYFDMVVNGGGDLVIDCEREGYLRVQRPLLPSWGERALLPDDIVMIPADANTSPIDLVAPPGEFQVAEGSTQSDARGERQGTLLVPAGVEATMHLEDGSPVNLDSMSIRITEFTVGTSGPDAMPAPLPAENSYTYAFEVNADEAVAANAPSITFSEPLPYYVDNFLGFEAGTAVPMGSFNRETGAWVAEESGIVLDIVGESGGLAEIDVTGDGLADSGATLAELEISEAELGALATQYDPGRSLWRVLIEHFTDPFDLNWPAYPEEAQDPDPPPPQPEPEPPCPSAAAGSIIDCEAQILRETIPVAGTPYSLNYSSARAPGRKAEFRTKIPIASGEPLGSPLATLDVYLAGREFHQSFEEIPGETPVFEWDGLDQFGRQLAGQQVATARIRYCYPGCYWSPERWLDRGFFQTLVCFPDRTLCRSTETTFPIGAFDARPLGLGGWTLDAQHSHTLATGRLELGDGASLDAAVHAPVFKQLANGEQAKGPMAIAPDGTIYVGRSDVFRFRPGEEAERLAGPGTGEGGYGGTGLPATDPSVRLSVSDLALGRDGSLYLAEAANHVIRRVRPDGILELVAGIPNVNVLSGQEGLASVTPLSFPKDLAVAPDGTLFVSTQFHVMRISTDGFMRRAVGVEGPTPPGTPVLPENGTPADEAAVFPQRIALSPGGILHVALPPHIVKVVDGRIELVAGKSADCPPNGICQVWQEGDVATDAELGMDPNFGGMAFDARGTLYIADRVPIVLTPFIIPFFYRVASITPEGVLHVEVGTADPKLAGRFPKNAVSGFSPYPDIQTMTASEVSRDIGPAIGTKAHPILDLALGPDGLYISGSATSSGAGGAIFRVSPIVPHEEGEVFTIGARGADAFYAFDRLGRHKRTVHSLTGDDLARLSYDASGLLTSITDEAENPTTIERSPTGVPLAIVSPFGQRTELELDANGYLSKVVDPEENETSMIYSPDGLLTTFTNARGDASTITYDELGRLETDEDPVGGFQTLERFEDGQTWSVERTTALDRTTVYATELDPGASWSQTVTAPDGTETRSTTGFDAISDTRSPDGTVTTVTATPDSRFGLNATVVSQTTQTPSGLSSTQTTSRTYGALNPDNLLDFFDRRDVSSRNGRNWTTVFEKPTLTFTTISPQGRETFRAIDAKGRTTRTQVEGLLPVELFYDASGRLDHVTQGARTTQNAYFPSGAAAGYLASITDATSVPTTFSRDALGRRLTETRSAATTTFSWDPTSNLASVTPPGKPTHDMNYNPVNQLETYEPPPTGLPASATSYAYDLDRMLRTETRPGGVSIVRTPDSAGRLDTVAIPGGLIDYDYFPPTEPSGAGKVSSIAGPYGVDLSFTYDGSLTKTTSWSGDVTGSVAWQYNNDFQKILETVSGVTGTASTAFGYDLDQLLTCASPTTCSPPGADALTLTRHPLHGMVTNISLGQTSEAWTYNGFGELARQTSSFNGAPLVDITYDEEGFERDALGRIVRKTETILGVTKVYEYRYDALRRLDQVKIDGVVDEAFTYDANGNRLTAFKADQGTVTATYDDQDRLLTHGEYEFTYTANGEMESKTNTANGDEWLFQYDAVGNLVSVGLPNGDLLEYLVDGIGRRVGKKKNGVLLKQWIYRNELKPAMELDADGTVIAEFSYGSKFNMPDYVRRNGATYRVVSDHLGSPIYAVNIGDSGDTPFQASYTSFGRAIGTALDWMPFGFAGGLLDPDTGLIRFGWRDYDPHVGRWTSKDPIRFDGGVNLYGYIDNNPVLTIDPTGTRFSQKECAGIGNAYFATCVLVGCVPTTPGIVTAAICVFACAALGNALTDECDRINNPEEKPTSCGSTPTGDRLASL